MAAVRINFQGDVHLTLSGFDPPFRVGAGLCVSLIPQPGRHPSLCGLRLGVPKTPSSPGRDLRLERPPSGHQGVGEADTIGELDTQVTQRHRRPLVDQKSHVHQGTGGIRVHPVIDVRIEESGSLVEPPEPDHILLQLDRIESLRGGRADER